MGKQEKARSVGGHTRSIFLYLTLRHSAQSLTIMTEADATRNRREKESVGIHGRLPSVYILRYTTQSFIVLIEVNVGEREGRKSRRVYTAYLLMPHDSASRHT